MDIEAIRRNFGTEVRNLRTNLKNSDPVWTQKYLGNYVNNSLNLKLSNDSCQKLISDIEQGKPNHNITCDVIYQLQKILSISEEVVIPIIDAVTSVLHGKKTDTTKIQIHEFDNLLVETKHSVFNHYIGEYYCLFYSTDSSNPKTVDAKLTLSSKEVKGINICYAQFFIINNEKLIKSYSGQFFINIHYNTWYCILIGEKKQEVSMLISSHINSNIKNNLLNVALVLTTAAGSNKRPTMHRMIISRKKFSSKQKAKIVSQLKLNSDMITISEENLKSIKQQTESKINQLKSGKSKSKYIALLKCVNLIMTDSTIAQKQIYYSFPESFLYDNKQIFPDGKNKSFVISNIREKDNNRYYNKTSSTVQEICIDIMYGDK